MKTPEFWEKKAIREYLDSIGAWHFNPYMAGYGKSGVPDIVGCYKSRFFSVEVKRPGVAPTALQARRIQEIREQNGFAIAGSSEVVISELERWINALS